MSCCLRVKRKVSVRWAQPQADDCVHAKPYWREPLQVGIAECSAKTLPSRHSSIGPAASLPDKEVQCNGTSSVVVCGRFSLRPKPGSVDLRRQPDRGELLADKDRCNSAVRDHSTGK